MAFKSAAENLFEDDQQLWTSNLPLKNFEDDQQLWPSNLLLKTYEDQQQLWPSNLLLLLLLQCCCSII